MTVEDKRIIHLEKISLDKIRINLSSPIVFLCGGEVDVTKPTPPSVRDALLGYLANKDNDLLDQIILAENFKDWLHDAVYKDLLIFEDDIAHISSLIVIILESPGALAELGVFCKNQNLKRKILVIVNDDHYNQSSFIKLGLLRHLEDTKLNSVCSYPWQVSNLQQSLGDNLKHIQQDIRDALKDIDKSESFNHLNEGHIAFLIFEIIKIFRALKFSEINDFLEKINLKIKADKISRLLFLLDKFNLVGKYKYGNVDYFYANSEKEKIHFGNHFNPTTVKMASMKFYMESNDSRRLAAIAKIYSATGKQGNDV